MQSDCIFKVTLTYFSAFLSLEHELYSSVRTSQTAEVTIRERSHLEFGQNARAFLHNT